MWDPSWKQRPGLRDERRATHRAVLGLMTGMPNPYYSSGEALKAKNVLAGGATLDFPEFALAELDLDEVRVAVDAGCGWGRFAVPLLRRAPQLHQLICADIWPGMIETARTSVREAGSAACYVTADVCRLPLTNAFADLAMANHMLYELTDVPTAVAELARVLRRDGQLLATTYSDSVRVPLTELHFATLAAIGHSYPPPRPSSFSLENGRALLLEFFDEVDCHVLEDATSVTDAEALVQFYVTTGGYDWASRDEAIPLEDRRRIPDVFRELAESWLDTDGAITSLTRWTAFVARSPKPTGHTLR